MDGGYVLFPVLSSCPSSWFPNILLLKGNCSRQSQQLTLPRQQAQGQCGLGK